MVAVTDGAVVAFGAEIVRKPKRQALVDEEPHGAAEAAASIGLGMASTSIWAKAKHALMSSMVKRG